jgi:hypothetical protein
MENSSKQTENTSHTYLSIREKFLDDIEEVIKKLELRKHPVTPPIQQPIKTHITRLEKSTLDKLKEINDDPTFWF